MSKKTIDFGQALNREVPIAKTEIEPLTSRAAKVVDDEVVPVVRKESPHRRKQKQAYEGKHTMVRLPKELNEELGRFSRQSGIPIKRLLVLVVKDFVESQDPLNKTMELIRRYPASDE